MKDEKKTEKGSENKKTEGKPDEKKNKAEKQDKEPKAAGDTKAAPVSEGEQVRLFQLYESSLKVKNSSLNSPSLSSKLEFLPRHGFIRIPKSFTAKK